MLKNGFTKSFATSKEAYDFWRLNRDNTPEDCYLGIPHSEPTLVRVSLIQEHRTPKRKDELSPVRGIIRDDLPGGVNGMVSHADGKRYDSKSQYNAAVRAAGCRVVGNDMNGKEYSRPPVRGDFNVGPALKNATQEVLSRHR